MARAWFRPYCPPLVIIVTRQQVASNKRDDVRHSSQKADATTVCINIDVLSFANDYGESTRRSAKHRCFMGKKGTPPSDITSLSSELQRLGVLRSQHNNSKHGITAACFGEVVRDTLRGPSIGFSDILQLLPADAHNVAVDADAGDDGVSRPATTHHDLQKYLSDFDLSQFNCGVGSVVGVVMPNGPELAVAVLAVMAYATVAPVNASNTAEEIKNELLDVGASAVLLAGSSDSCAGLLELARDCGITAIVTEPG